MGDPAGVGPELCLQLLSTSSVLRECHPVVFGDLTAIQKTAAHMGISFPECAVVQGKLAGQQTDAPATFIDLASDVGADLVAGQISAHTGKASFQFIESAIASTPLLLKSREVSREILLSMTMTVDALRV